MEDMIDMTAWPYRQRNSSAIDNINQIFNNYINVNFYKKRNYGKFTTIEGLYKQSVNSDEIYYLVEFLGNGIWIWELKSLVLTEAEKTRLTELYEKNL